MKIRNPDFYDVYGAFIVQCDFVNSDIEFRFLCIYDVTVSINYLSAGFYCDL